MTQQADSLSAWAADLRQTSQPPLPPPQHADSAPSSAAASRLVSSHHWGQHAGPYTAGNRGERVSEQPTAKACRCMRTAEQPAQSLPLLVQGRVMISLPLVL